MGKIRFRECVANLAEVRNHLFTEYFARARALSRSYFYGLVAADVYVNRRVSCTPPGFTYPPRVLWSLVTPYGVDGAQRVARRSLRVQKAERRSRAQSFILETLSRSLSLFFSLSSLFLDQHLEAIAEKDSGTLLCLGHRRSLHAFHGRLPCYALPRFLRRRLSQMTPIRDHSFRGTVTREYARTEDTHDNLNDSSSRRLSSVLSPGCIIHATRNVARVSPYACFASRIFKTHRHNMHRVIAYKRSG